MDQSDVRDCDALDFPIGLKLSDLPDCNKMHKEMITDLVKHDSIMKLEKYKPYGTTVRVNLATIALFRFGTTVYAIDDICPHQGGPLHLGDIENLVNEAGRCSVPCVVCPWHRWTFRLDNGQRIRRIKSDVNDLESNGPVRNFTIHGTCGASVKIYSVLMDKDENLYIRFREFDNRLFNCNDFCL